jgi:zinc carboxypeptidase
VSRFIRTLPALLCLLAAPSFAFAQDRPDVPPWTEDAPEQVAPKLHWKPKVEIAWNRYLHIDEFYALMRRFEQAYPDLVKLEVIGKSVEGRDLLLATINDASTGAADKKPAFWCDGNIHGNEVQAGEACLYLIWYLCEQRDRLPKIRKMLAERSFYILPSLNPDGRAHWFDAPNTMHSSRGGKRPVDNDRDGRFDEDPANDLDGDGEILQMRIKDPNGRFKPHPDDPRRMIPVKPGERGSYRIIGQEGIDDDGDGRINEDGPGGYDPNRDWPAYWRGPAEQRGAGPYPLALPESRAVANFVVAHPNIAGFQSFHNTGGMILRGPGAKGYGKYPAGDDRVMREIGERGTKILPLYRNLVIWKDLYTVYGGEVNFAYETLGIYAYTNELWTRSNYHRRAPGGDARDDRMFFEDNVEFGARYAPWKPFDHPTLGPIELGGWRKETNRVAPSFMIEEMLHRNAAFVLFHANEMPLVVADEASITDLAGGFRAVTATFRNDRIFPTRSAQSALKKIGAPDRVTFTGPENLSVISVGVVSPRTGRVDDPKIKRAGRFDVENGIAGNAAVTLRWVVRGTGKAKITYASEKGGSVSLDIDLR